jgi:hypothetical protein
LPEMPDFGGRLLLSAALQRAHGNAVLHRRRRQGRTELRIVSAATWYWTRQRKQQNRR